MSILAAVCFVVCHGGPADHFATFAEKVPEVEIYASGPALDKLKERGISVQHPFSLKDLSHEQEDQLAEQIAKTCAAASIVMTDVGHAFDIKVQKALSKYAPQVVRMAYYDNPESYVPGGYSEVAKEVMSAAQKVLFANSHLVTEIPVKGVESVGLGYYPLGPAEKIAARRQSDRLKLREQFFLKKGLKDRGQKIFVYCGGNNEEYFTKAFPAFVSFLKEIDMSDSVILLQQHPGAKAKNRDGELFPKNPQLFVSDLSTEEAQVVADGVMYYQTSMGPQFVLAGIPVIQVGHEKYRDLLVRKGLCSSVTSAKELQVALNEIQRDSIPSKELISEGLGLKPNWPEILKKHLK